MISWTEFSEYSFDRKINTLYTDGNFVMAIRYYGFKINLYLLGSFYVEVFVNHKLAKIEKIQRLDTNHSRMKFYYDQIKLPQSLA
ncbi:MAG: hypothetical protein R2820_07550 [Cyclobacteriaceae bacterium]|nr:hypothetical protein [Cyclobacteriaceae bacterium]